MDVTVRRSRVSGTARAPASKSYTHRAVLAGGYAEETQVERPLDSADIAATVGAVEAFGATVTLEGSALAIDGFGSQPTVPEDVVDCANSGTTMRLATATAALVDGTTVLTGDASLRSRPQRPLLEAIGSLGGRAVSTRGNGQAPLVVTGPIDGGQVAIPGDVSSQFISALLMAGAVTTDGIDLTLTTALRSAPYVEITREVLEAFGVRTDRHEEGFSVPGGQTYDRAGEPYAVPGDFSSMSYLLAAGAIAGEGSLRVEGAHPSAQGDSAIIDYLRAMGASVEWDRDVGIVTTGRAALSGTEIDVGDTPDLLPTLAVLGAVADGTTRLVNAEHVRYKETDRVSVMAESLERLGATVEEHPDELVIHGGESALKGTTLDGHGDHRIVMALAIAGLVAAGETTIQGAEHADVSFPAFFDALAALGAQLERHETG